MENQNSPSGIDDSEIQELRQEIINQIDDRISSVMTSLPPQYFQQLGDAERLEHFKALVAVKVCGIDQEITLKKQDGSRVSVISCENYPGQLARMVEDLPDDFPLVGANIFTSAGEDFIVDVFEFRIDVDEEILASETDFKNLDNLVQQVMGLTERSQEAVEDFIKRYHKNHQILDSPEEIAQQFVALKETEHINDIKVLWKLDSPQNSKPSATVTISAASSTTRSVLLRAASFLGKNNYDIRRAVCENVVVRDNIDVALLTFHVFYWSDEKTDPESLSREFETFLRMDEEVVTPSFDGQESPLEIFGNIEIAELFSAFSRLTQHAVNFCDSRNVSHERVLRSLLKQKSFVEDVLAFFRLRFDSEFDHEKSRDLIESFDSRLDAISDATDQQILGKFVQLSRGIQRCNFNVPRRRCLAFRIPGGMFENVARGESPYAIFYVFGSGFDGFHVRFRDVARGGMRLVPTRNRDHYLFETSRVFDEAWRLASAQQLKNKDIAEGGAKAVVVAKPDTDLQKAGRDFVDGLLDLIVDPTKTFASDVIQGRDYEHLYLGPDENVSNELINWIVERSSQRGYAFPSTIMSSKPVLGINHKKYGVTSEGVLVFLRHALIEFGIDPDQETFSVKLTGGPDGDVGGNAIKILIRDYQSRAKIVAISDGTGSACDPQGLNHDELLRLVEGELGIVHFSESKLTAGGSVMGLENERQIARRNQLHNEIHADVFIPAGGRPSTINETNWEEFLDKSNEPTSRIIVEGANLFLTEEARLGLAGAGVTIVKDSSANKCGVICSSLEIIAGMLLSEEEFVRIKPTYVSEVLELLRELARTEAISLFNEHLRRPDLTLPKISVLLSQQIIRVADVIHQSFSQWTPEEQKVADECIDLFLPQSLVKHFSSPLCEQIPSNYRKHLIAAILSSRIVYREGIQNLATMNQHALEELVRSHVLYESQVRKMLAQLSGSDLPDREQMIRILEHSGARGQRELRMPKN